MKFELDAVFVEHGCEGSALATRVLGALPREVPVTMVADAREAARPVASAPDPFGAGKRRLVIAPRKTPFLMPCPAGSSKFACCGYLVLTLASNCPMDCSYCFLQEYLADNPAFQVYANFADSFDELDRLSANARGRSFRVGTGELADSLAFDSLTGDQPRPDRFLCDARKSDAGTQNQDRRNRKSARRRSARPRIGFVDFVARGCLSKLGASDRVARRSESRRRAPCSTPATASRFISIR